MIHSDGFKMEQPIRKAWRNAVVFFFFMSLNLGEQADFAGKNSLDSPMVAAQSLGTGIS